MNSFLPTFADLRKRIEDAVEVSKDHANHQKITTKRNSEGKKEKIKQKKEFMPLTNDLLLLKIACIPNNAI